MSGRDRPTGRADETAHPTTGPSLGIRSLPNLRDLGGHPTVDGGRVRSGLIYRSTDLSRVPDDDLAALGRLGIRAVYDLRTLEEQQAQPDRLPAGAVCVGIDVLADSSQASPMELMRLFSNPSTARKLLGGGRGRAFWAEKYREFVLLPSARAGYGRLFAGLAEVANRPAVVHCTTGKDRTGWAAAALLLLLGVPEGVVVDEYMLSARFLRSAFRPARDAFRAQGGDPRLLAPVAAVRRDYLATALETIRESFGSIEAYFDEGLGIDDATQRELQTVFTERS